MAIIEIQSATGFTHEYSYQVPGGNYASIPYASPRNDRVRSDSLCLEHNHQWVDGYSPGRDGLYSNFLYIRFALVAPKGAVIEPTYLQFHSNGGNNVTMLYDIVGTAVDNALDPNNTGATLYPPTSPAYLALDKTISFTPWTIGVMPAYGEHLLTPDISPILTELCTRSGWVSGNHVGLIIAPDGVKDLTQFYGAAYAGTHYQTAKEVQTSKTFTNIIDTVPGNYSFNFILTQATIIG